MGAGFSGLARRDLVMPGGRMRLATAGSGEK